MEVLDRVVNVMCGGGDYHNVTGLAGAREKLVEIKRSLDRIYS